MGGEAQGGGWHQDRPRYNGGSERVKRLSKTWLKPLSCALLFN
jgi:hypothetical protein